MKRGRPRVPAEIEAMVCDLLRGGETVPQIAYKVPLEQSTIRKIARRNGVIVPRAKPGRVSLW